MHFAPLPERINERFSRNFKFFFKIGYFSLSVNSHQFQLGRTVEKICVLHSSYFKTRKREKKRALIKQFLFLEVGRVQILFWEEGEEEGGGYEVGAVKN